MSKTFGDVMRHWRGVRRFSQLSLSVETGISSRHISFLETGRSRPTRGSVLTLARALDLPKPIVNDALHAAGFSPEYPVHDPTDVNLRPMTNALTLILENHAPLPAIVIDGNWQIVGGNFPAMHLMQFLPLKGSSCVVDALLNDDPDNSIFLNWDVVASWTLHRLQSETARAGNQGDLSEISDRLAQSHRYAASDHGSVSVNSPYLTMNIRVDGHDLSLFTMLAEFSTAQDVAMSERRVELFFAADEHTQEYFDTVAQSN